jgi:hypothetical protein
MKGYMSLKEKIAADFITAYKAKEAEKVSVLRMIQSAIKNAEIDSKQELTDEDVNAILAKQAKQRKDAIAQYKSGNRDDLVKKEESELTIIEDYLPKQMSEEDITAIVEAAIAKTGATSKADMGKVMGAIMPQVKGKADGSLVSKIVTEKLS